MAQLGNGLDDGVRPVGSVYDYGDGLRVGVGDVVAHLPVDAAAVYGARQGDDLVRVTLHLTNTADTAVDVEGVELLVRGGPYGKTGRQIEDDKGDMLDGRLEGVLRPGRSMSATWAYSVPADSIGDLDIEVRFPYARERDKVVFTTAEATAARLLPTPRQGSQLPDQSPLFGDHQESLRGAAQSQALPASVPSELGDDLDAARVRQIFRFLAEAEESKARPVRTLDGAAGIVWFDELPDDSGVDVMLDGVVAADEPAWLTVARPDRPDAPHPDDLLAPWIDITRVRDFKQQRAPHLRRRIDPEFPDWSRGIPLGKTYHELDEHPEREKIEKLYAAWEQDWLAWAETRRAIDPLVKLYDRLHKMHEDAANLGEAYELVLGFGRLTWQTPTGQRVERHLVTHRATVQLDAATGTLTVVPDPTGVGLELEENMLEGAQHVPGPVRERIVEELEGASDVTDPDHLDALHTALRSWVNAAHSAGSYVQEVDRARPRTLDVPHVGFTPALVLRERSRRSTTDALKAIARQIDNGTPPTELLSYIAGRDGAQTAADLAAGEDGAGTQERETYFALPANEQQRTIAERLRSNRLVVVQGPPGTGKTHTIANLVTDLLAQGKRVLITSHTPRALRVLRDKLPESIRHLCVSRTEDGAAARRELEASVQRILTEYAGYDPKAAQADIRVLQTKLATARATQRAMLRDLAVLREQETVRFEAEIGDYSGSPQEIAERLSRESDRFGWVGPVPQEQPTITADDALQLLHTTRQFTPHLKALAADVPGPAELPTPGDFDEAVAVVQAAEEAHTAVRQDPVSAEYDTAVRTLDAERQQALATALDTFAAARARAASLAGATGPWAAALLTEVAAGHDWQTRSRHAAVTEALTAAEACLATLGTAMVSGLDGFDAATALAQATTLHDGLAQGQKLKGTLGMRSKLAKAVGDFAAAVRVDGRAPEDAATAAVVLARVQLELRLNQVESEWGGAAGAWQGHGPRLARLRQDIETLHALLAVASTRTEVVTAAATSPDLVNAAWQEAPVERAVRALLRAATTLREAERSRRLLTDAEELLREWSERPGVSPAVARALDSVRARDTDGYREFSQEMAEVREAARLRAAHHMAHTRVREAFPSLAERITARPGDGDWDTRLPLLEKAWAWSAWRERMERLTDPDAERALRRRLTEADDEARIVLTRLAAARAWHRCLGLLTGDQSRALSAYQQAARRIKGKYQHRYRRDAQAALSKAQTAVPAWIMPLHQVAETVPTDKPGMFDVVIVDEASQSGLEAMLLSWMADRMVVVGDSKQVSPANVGLKQDEYFHLRDRLLTSLEPDVRSLFGPESSFFDLTEALSSGRGALMLEEHFRCMPEIISFSNELCYNGRLQPLRQYGADRLPPVHTVHVENGEAVGTSSRLVNTAEAEALVDALVRCCSDPAYEGRTMGVISLRSTKAHVAYLENLLAERLDYEQREARRIRVGDAEDFQGDERHVMFISCVNSATTAAGTVPGGFTGKTYEQRLNVAASRAQDQVWVFHSARTEQFHENDLRRDWLDHLTRPAEEDTAAVEGDVLPDVRHEAFDSLFQQQVYLELVARNYRVRPGYRVGRHAIDLVVEGGTRRLAVACDGDTFAEGDDAAQAAGRQRDLERVDWTFVRIRGSRFHLDREQALAPLWAELERLGIEPVELGTGDAAESADAEAAPPAPEADPALDVTGAEPKAESPATAVRVAPSPERSAAATPEAAHHERSVPRSTVTAAPLRTEPSRQPARSAERTPLRPARPALPVEAVPPAAFQRVLREMQALQAALDTPAEAPSDVDAANLVFLRRSQADQRDRWTRRLGFLRSFLDAVQVDPQAAEASKVVVPGALLVLEFDGRLDSDTLYTIAELSTDEAEMVSPSSPLGHAMLWQRTGQEIPYETSQGVVRAVVVRDIRF
ncbi:AAA domain-containing protein [Streptomyces sp. VRA16 Mangrove soil]|uniref:AAA domain-containing protein n=1 Tax=Streptomyces sp. VRA16 Mangrove soil TaxID=2817434 RepID=UPI001A9DFA2D|nr:AAA domain-containing protein [Streptomyces sp. VRA16 Mangrove soil]MBO1330963.1 AAA family ATPase [Streptomyces sp. VRA16 Mangrove soil]